MSHLSHGTAPQSARRNYQILRIPPSGKMRFRCLTPTWIATETHWNGKGTDLCPQTDLCQACLAGVAKVWKGYFLGESTTSRAIRCVELTQLAAFGLKELVWRAESLAGAIICISRSGKAKNGPCTAWIETWDEILNEHTMDAAEHCVLTIYRAHRVELKSADCIDSPR